MYKTYNDVIINIGTCDETFPMEFDDHTIPGSGSAAIAHLLAKEDVQSVREGEGFRINTLIPYHAIEFAQVTTTRESADAPQDDTCKGDNPEPGPAVGDFVIRNTSDSDTDLYLYASGNHVGTFGDVTFTEYESEEDISSASSVSVPSGGSVTISGLPVGTNVYIDGEGDDPVGTVPGSYEWSGHPWE